MHSNNPIYKKCFYKDLFWQFYNDIGQIRADRKRSGTEIGGGIGKVFELGFEQDSLFNDAVWSVRCSQG